jgi:hypothetical protein
MDEAWTSLEYATTWTHAAARRREVRLGCCHLAEVVPYDCIGVDKKAPECTMLVAYEPTKVEQKCAMTIA